MVSLIVQKVAIKQRSEVGISSNDISSLICPGFIKNAYRIILLRNDTISNYSLWKTPLFQANAKIFAFRVNSWLLIQQVMNLSFVFLLRFAGIGKRCQLTGVRYAFLAEPKRFAS